MKNLINISIFSLGLLFSTAAFAQTEPVSTKKQEEPKKTAQDSTKKPGTRMAINSQGLPTKGTKSTNNSNRTVSDPKKEETKTTKKDESKK
ncbi:MAG: hypothetical protein K0S33_3178 [Bacteroidetes bacterium]|jgi:hypothetical protein|nr:hypothetical protein [Bacteroidota bacterium]